MFDALVSPIDETVSFVASSSSWVVDIVAVVVVVVVGSSSVVSRGSDGLPSSTASSRGATPNAEDDDDVSFSSSSVVVVVSAESTFIVVVVVSIVVSIVVSSRSNSITEPAVGSVIHPLDSEVANTRAATTPFGKEHVANAQNDATTNVDRTNELVDVAVDLCRRRRCRRRRRSIIPIPRASPPIKSINQTRRRRRVRGRFPDVTCRFF